MRAYPKKYSKHNTRKSPEGNTRCPLCEMLFADIQSMQVHLHFCRAKREKDREDGWRLPP